MKFSHLYVCSSACCSTKVRRSSCATSGGREAEAAMLLAWWSSTCGGAASGLHYSARQASKQPQSSLSPYSHSGLSLDDCRLSWCRRTWLPLARLPQTTTPASHSGFKWLKSPENKFTEDSMWFHEFFQAIFSNFATWFFCFIFLAVYCLKQI